MKRKVLGLAVVVLAISLSAFVKRPVHTSSAQYYWFPLNTSSGLPLGSQRLVYQSYDPYLCASWAWGPYCSGAWTSYTGSGPYFAAGMQTIEDFAIVP